MSDLPQQNTIVQYLADGIEDQYLFAFYVPDDVDIEVYVTPVGQTPIPESDIQELGVAYTVTQNVDPITGGYITFLPGYIPAAGSSVTLNRNVQASLDVEFANGQNFNGANLDAALDKLLLLIQQNQTYALQRNLSYRVNTYLTNEQATIQANTQLQPLLPGYIWQGAADGGVVAVLLEENPDVSTLRSELASQSPTTNGASLVGYYDQVNSLPTTVKAFLDNIVTFMQTQLEAQLWQPGDLKDHASATVPTGWLSCDGSAVSRTTYAALFAAIGTTWGSGDGSTTFNLPDFRRRTSVGSGGSGSVTLGNAVGNVGGEETHTQTIAEMPAHDHTGSFWNLNTFNASSGGSPVPIYSGGSAHGNTPVSVASQGGGSPFNVIQPSGVVLKIIKT